LILLSRKSTAVYDELDWLSESQKKEYLSLKRLSLKCEEFKLKFIGRTNNASEIDCFINNKRIQCKFSSKKVHNQFEFHVYRHTDKKNVRPYSDKDQLDFFIFETFENNEGTFYVIPMATMIHWGYIRTDEQDGNVLIYISNMGVSRMNKAHKFINKFDLLR
jgi:hypothetical protein